MPLIKSSSKQAFKANVRTLMHDVGKSPHVQSRQQALAIAYATKRRKRSRGGMADGGDPEALSSADFDQAPQKPWPTQAPPNPNADTPYFKEGEDQINQAFINRELDKLHRRGVGLGDISPEESQDRFNRLSLAAGVSGGPGAAVVGDVGLLGEALAPTPAGAGENPPKALSPEEQSARHADQSAQQDIVTRALARMPGPRPTTYPTALSEWQKKHPRATTPSDPDQARQLREEDVNRAAALKDQQAAWDLQFSGMQQDIKKEDLTKRQIAEAPPFRKAFEGLYNNLGTVGMTASLLAEPAARALLTGARYGKNALWSRDVGGLGKAMESSATNPEMAARATNLAEQLRQRNLNYAAPEDVGAARQALSGLGTAGLGGLVNTMADLAPSIYDKNVLPEGHPDKEAANAAIGTPQAALGRAWGPFGIGAAEALFGRYGLPHLPPAEAPIAQSRGAVTAFDKIQRQKAAAEKAAKASALEEKPSSSARKSRANLLPDTVPPELGSPQQQAIPSSIDPETIAAAAPAKRSPRATKLPGVYPWISPERSTGGALSILRKRAAGGAARSYTALSPSPALAAAHSVRTAMRAAGGSIPLGNSATAQSPSPRSHTESQRLSTGGASNNDRAQMGQVRGYAAGGMSTPPWYERREASEMMHSGPIASAVPGRTDLHNMSVKSGSYVLPAETISHLGQSNSIAGLHIAGKMFGNSGPFGAGTLAIRHASGLPRPPKAMTNFASGGFSEGGGRGDPSTSKVPIVAAGGEFIVEPSVVRNIGNGSIEAGHKILDRFVMSKRQEHIKTLRGLAPPAKK